MDYYMQEREPSTLFKIKCVCGVYGMRECVGVGIRGPIACITQPCQKHELYELKFCYKPNGVGLNI